MLTRWIEVARIDVRQEPYAAVKATYDALVAQYGRVKAHVRGEHFIVIRAQATLRGRGRVAA